MESDDDKKGDKAPPKSGTIELEDDVQFVQMDDDKKGETPPPKSGS